MTERRVALVGNPNCGKTTILNRLTGSKQKVGNWPGVTVVQKSGVCQVGGESIEIVDLPGIYSLVTFDQQSGQDERVAAEYLASQAVDCIVNIIDASHLERQLYLTAQLLEMQIPMIIVLNMTDVAARRGVHIDDKLLTTLLGCPVIPLIAHKGQGLDTLHAALAKVCCQSKTAEQRQPAYPSLINEAVADLVALGAGLLPQSRFGALRLLEGCQSSQHNQTPELVERIATWQQRIKASLAEDADIVIADSRYGFVHEIGQHVIHHKKQMRKTISARIDRIVLNRYLGIPIFLAVMYSLFVFSINLGGAFQDCFALASQALFVDGADSLLQTWHAPFWLHGLLAHGVGIGIHTTLTFVPVLSAMFFMLSILESSGYMARAAFVMDRLLRVLGLPGKAFLPLIVGFGCNVPAIMAARTLDSDRERIITILMAPFMSCSARLAVYAVFVSAFFPVGGHNVIFSLYLIGIVCAILTGLVMQRSLLKGEPSPLLLELPAYHAPNLRNVLFQTRQRVQGFLWRAGKVIIPVCLCLGLLQHVTVPLQVDGSSTTLLVWFGKLLTPIFTPMGITSDNWPATVALLTGMLAKEVLIGTLNTLYAQASHLASGVPPQFDLILALKHALSTIPENLRAFLSSYGNPVLASAPQQSINSSVYGEFVRRFATASSAYAYLLFVLLYIPCVSTYAVTVRELSRGWANFSLVWSLMLAYTLAVMSYQLATWTVHPLTSFLWCFGLGTVVAAVLAYLRFYRSSSRSLRALREASA